MKTALPQTSQKEKPTVLTEVLTCHVLRRDGAGLPPEGVLTVTAEDCLRGQALGLVPSSICGAVVIIEMNDVFQVASVLPLVGQPILLSQRLDSIDHLDWEAGGGRPTCYWTIILVAVSHSAPAQLTAVY